MKPGVWWEAARLINFQEPLASDLLQRPFITSWKCFCIGFLIKHLICIMQIYWFYRGKKMNLVIWSSPAKRLIFSRGLLMEPLVPSKFEQHCRSGEHPCLQSHRLGAVVFISASQTQSSDWGCREAQAVEHEHECLKWTPLSRCLLLLFISCPFLWLWSSDLWKGWSRLPRKVLWGNGSRAKITLPARSRRVRIPPCWCLWTKILEEWEIWHIKDPHLLWLNCRLARFSTLFTFLLKFIEGLISCLIKGELGLP